MLYYLSLTDIKLLVTAWLLMLVYMGVISAIMPWHVLLRCASMALVFALGYGTVMASTAILGKPLITDEEKVGLLGGYLPWDWDGKRYMVLLLKTDQGAELVAAPYTPGDDTQLQDSMQRWVKSGQATLVRKRPNGITVDKERQGSGSDANQNGQGEGQGLEFYEFNQDVLKPKDQQ